MVTLGCAMIILLFALHTNRLIVMRRTFFILGILYTLRTLSMLCTQLPSAYIDNGRSCDRQLNASERTLAIYIDRVLAQTLRIGFQDLGSKMLCGDLLFSGHSLMMIVCALTIGYYLPAPLRPLRHIPNITAAIGAICMVISRLVWWRFETVRVGIGSELTTRWMCSLHTSSRSASSCKSTLVLQLLDQPDCV